MKRTSTILFLIISFIVLSLATTSVAANNFLPSSTSISLPSDVKSIILDYSQYLSSGNTLNDSSYNQVMKNLVSERRNFYKEYYSLGLHSTLETINSRFVIDESSANGQTNNDLSVKVNEIVTLNGHPVNTLPDKDPLIIAARWAINQSNNVNVQSALENYIDMRINGIEKSVTNGVSDTFIIKHVLIFTTQNGNRVITQDVFDDKSNDNPFGFDVMTWSYGKQTRIAPDFTQMVGYYIYNQPIETLGQSLLDDYSKAYGSISPDGTGFYYNRAGASNYALQYGINTSSTCPGNSTVKMNTSNYNQNSDYKRIWTYTTSTCNDCADFVSQALRAGSFPTDTIWYYLGTDPYDNHPGAYTWRVFDNSSGNPMGLAYYLNNYLGAITSVSRTSLQIGDIMYVSSTNHVVMVTQSDGTGVYYSGHTSDRHNVVWSSGTGLDKFWHIHDYIQ